MRRPPIVSALLLLAALPALAATYDPTQVVTARTKEDFAKQYATVTAAMNPGGKYELVQGRERETVMRRLHEIGAILDGYEPGARLRDEPMAALLTAQEEVNGILAHGDKDRLVCTSSSPTGSHLKKSECLRYGELEANRRRTEKEMRDRQATPCNSRLCNDNR